MLAKRFFSILISSALVLIPACGGEFERQGDEGSAVAGETPAVKTDEIPACSAVGAAASCDPMTLTGCGEASCYLTKGVGTSCVCSPGAVKLGDQCNTSVECEPGTVCAGKVAPGICRAVCTPGECPDTMNCIVITGLEPFGYCEPK